MFLKNRVDIAALRAETEALKKEVFGEKEHKNEEGGSNPYSLLPRLFAQSFYSSYAVRSTLKERVDRQGEQIEKLDERLDKHELLIDTILNHFKLEYHKVTDENGTTVVRHELRKQKKVKSRRDYDDED